MDDSGQREFLFPRIALFGACRTAVAEAFSRCGGVRLEGLEADCGEDALAAVDLCVFVGPLSPFESALRAVLGRRLPLAVSCASAAEWASLDRLARAARKRRLQTGVLGSLRLAPAFARVREWIAGGVLGEIRGVRLWRRDAGVDALSARIELFRDVDLVSWLAGTAPAESRIRAGYADRVAVSVGDAGGEENDDGNRAPEAGRRHLRVEGTLGTVYGSVLVPPADHGGHIPPTALAFAHGARRRRLRIPAGESLMPDLAAVLDGVRRREPWLCLPGLAEAAAAAEAAENFFAGETRAI